LAAVFDGIRQPREARIEASKLRSTDDPPKDDTAGV